MNPKAGIEMERRKRGLPKTMWISEVERSMSERDLQPDDWEYRKRWELGTMH